MRIRTIGTALAVAALGAPDPARATGCTTPSFAQPLVYAYNLPSATVPLIVYSVHTGDFNGDGKLDLVAGTTYSPTGDPSGNIWYITVLLGHGDGSFDGPVNHATGGTGPGHPGDVAIADVNGDGKLDVAVVNATSNDVAVLLGNGDGTFQTPLHQAVMYPSAVALGDFNGDGKLDLAVARGSQFFDSCSVSVLPGNGDGTFQAAVTVSVTPEPDSLAIGDFNGDGKLDLAVAIDHQNSSNSTYTSSVSVLLGNGDATFQPEVNYVTGNLGSTQTAVADFNGDGKPDIVSSDGGVLLGKGDGTLQATVNAGSSGSLVVVGDFNGDGRPDVVIGQRTLSGPGGPNGPSVLVSLGNGDGSFQTATGYIPQSWPQSLAIGDFNGDGTPDIADAIWAAQIGILPNTCGAHDTIDFNHDGQSDLLLQRTDGAVQAWIMTPKTPTVMTQTDIWNGALSGWTVVGAGDFFANGQSDIVIQHTNGSVALWSMNGTTITSGQYVWPYEQPDWKVRGVGDFNGDGWPDILLQHTNGSVALWIMRGTTVVNGGYLYPQELSDWTVRGIGDFTGDGHPEILIQHTNGSIALWTINPGTSFPFIAAGQYVYAFPLANWTVRGTDDYDGDGKTDILLQHTNGSLVLWSMNGTTLLDGQYIWPFAMNWTIRAAR